MTKSGVELKIEPTLPSVRADASDLKRAFDNLINNAIKYASDQPNAVIEVGGSETQYVVRYFVRDNGPGIDPDYHEKIFGLFQRLETSKEGTGLGLASVRKIMRMHGGRAWVESELGKGATFWLEFTRPQSLIQTVLARTFMTAHLLTFLLVEDDDNHAHLVTRSLAKARVQNRVFRVADGEAALLFLRQQGEYESMPHPDVILLDLKLPKLNGHEVLAAIKEDDKLKSIPVVVMTTSDAESDRARAYEHHANSYVVKPVNFDRFRELVQDLCLYWGVWNEPPEKE